MGEYKFSETNLANLFLFGQANDQSKLLFLNMNGCTNSTLYCTNQIFMVAHILWFIQLQILIPECPVGSFFFEF